MTNRLPRLHK